MSVIESKHTFDLKFIPLPEGTSHAESEEDNAQLRNMKGMIMNVALLPLHTIHALHQGVSDEIWIKEQHGLSVISEEK